MLSPPPIKEPWRMDPQGRLLSPVWVLWLQEVSNAIQDDGLSLSGGDGSFSIGSSITEVDDTLAWFA